MGVVCFSAVLDNTHDMQFVIALDIIEDFLVGEGMKFLRLVSKRRLSPTTFLDHS